MQPFFVAPGAPPSPGNRILLISFHFPPDTAAGALRWQKLAGHLATAGWGLDVVTQDPAGLRGADRSRLDDLPPGTRVFGVAAATLLRDRVEKTAWRAFRTLRPRRPAAANGAAPAPPGANGSGAAVTEVDPRSWRRVVEDPRGTYHAWMALERDRSWAERAGAQAAKLLHATRYRALVTCGPPHMVHDAGCRAAADAGVPHVVDMRDPWSLVERLPGFLANPVSYATAERLERRVVRSAALVVLNTEPAREAMQRRYPERAGRIIAVPNGCDREEVPAAPPSSRFVVAYAGTIYLDRDPRVLFRAAGRVVRDLGLTPEQFGIELMGHVESFEGHSVESLAAAEGLDGFIRSHPRGTRQEALEFLSRAAMLVSLPQDSDLAIPSKIYEYMQFSAWLLAFATPESATGRLLAGSGADVVMPGDSDAVAAVLRARLAEFHAGRRAAPLAAEARFARATHAGHLIRAIEAYCAPDVRTLPRPGRAPRSGPRPRQPDATR